MKVVIIGAGGQLGGQLVSEFGSAAIPLDKNDLDLRNPAVVWQTIRRLSPDVVINAAAYTDVNGAESDRDTCDQVNVDGTRHLVEAIGDASITLVQISSDFVFGADETRDTPYVETDSPGPVNAYGHSKLASEREAAQCERHFIVRTCGLYVYRAAGSVTNFCETMLRRARRGQEVRVVNDQCVTPTYAPHLATAIRRLLATEEFGTYHIVNAGATTWHGFCEELFRQADIDVPVHPIASSEYPTAAKRPHYSVLDCSKFQSLTGQQLPPWQQGIREYLACGFRPQDGHS